MYSDYSENYSIRTRSALDGEWRQQYPTLVVKKREQTKFQKFLEGFGIGVPSPEPSPATPYLDKVETVENAKKYLNDSTIQDVEVVAEWYDSSGYCNWGEYTIWRNGRWTG